MIFEILEPEFLLPRLRMQCKKGALSAVKKEVTEDQSLFPRGHHHELASQLLPSIAANGKNLTWERIFSSLLLMSMLRARLLLPLVLLLSIFGGFTNVIVSLTPPPVFSTAIIPNPLRQQRRVHEEDISAACKFKARRRCNDWTLQQEQQQQEGEAADIIIAPAPAATAAIAKKSQQRKEIPGTLKSLSQHSSHKSPSRIFLLLLLLVLLLLLLLLTNSCRESSIRLLPLEKYSKKLMIFFLVNKKNLNLLRNSILSLLLLLLRDLIGSLKTVWNSSNSSSSSSSSTNSLFPPAPLSRSLHQLHTNTFSSTFSQSSLRFGYLKGCEKFKAPMEMLKRDHYFSMFSRIGFCVGLKIFF